MVGHRTICVKTKAGFSGLSKEFFENPMTGGQV